MFAFAIGLGQQENDLLAGEILALETSFSAVKVFDYIPLPELPLERLKHDSVNLPVLITANTVGYFGLLNADVGHDSNGFVVVL